MELKGDERTAWDIYFASILSIQHHPANREPMLPAKAAMLADQMLNERRKRCPQLG